MANDTETRADIVAEMRERAEAMEIHGTTRGVKRTVLEFADRLEAAWKREKAEAEAGALAVGGIVEAARQKPVGNAAAHAMTLDEAIAHAEDVAGKCDTSCKREHRQLADWLKELRDVKRTPVGNAAALREALELCYRIIHCAMVTGLINRDDANKAMDAYHSALSAPPRNCDVGTSKEQFVRFERFCFAHRTREKCCADCPLCYEPCCELAWAQMPYAEEGGAE